MRSPRRSSALPAAEVALHKLVKARFMPVAHRPVALLVLMLGALAAILAISDLHSQLHGASLRATLFAPDTDDMRQWLVRQSVLPRIVMTLLCGAALALAGTLAQQVLRNPLAEPMTLGIFPGAYLALMIAELWAPAWLAAGRTSVALAGGALATLLVFVLAWRQRMTPLAVILSGMLVNLYCGAIGLAIATSHFDLLRGLMIWGGGALDQTGWTDSMQLLYALLVCTVAVWLLRRPLGAFDAGDSTVHSLGIRLQPMRVAALSLAVILTASVVARVGVIGFIGLAAPTLSRLAGARRFGQRLLWAPALGAVLLWLTDELVLRLAAAELFAAHLLPTGTVTALLGVPLLLVLLPRLRPRPDLGATDSAPHGKLRRTVPLAALGLLLALWASVAVSRGYAGWRILDLDALRALAFWRIPHTVAALAAGVLLGLAGTLIQRVSANPMASPDLLGVSSGGALGMVVVLYAGLPQSPAVLFLACVGGAVLTLGLLVWLAARAAFAPERLLLVGVAVSAMFQAVVSAMLSTGDPRAGLLMNFVVGSVYYVEPPAAYGAAAVALLGLVLAPLTSRWLRALGLGTPVASSLGVPVARARLAVLLLAALLTATSTLLVGPLTFVGLIAPHIARHTGARSPRAQLLLAALIGALLIVFAEWLGRQLIFPEEMPAGLVATLIGAPYLAALLWRGRHGRA